VPLLHEHDARAYIGFDLRQGLRVYASVLPNVECGKMKSEGTHLPEKGINDQLGQPHTTVGGEAFTDQQEVAFEFLTRLIRVRITK
jgi:hypothetical protein